MVHRLILFDDLDGTPIEGNGGIVSFSIEGASYEIDLSNENALELRAIFSRYIRAGRRVRRQWNTNLPSVARKQGIPNQSKAREWAVENGYELSPMGRLPNFIQKAYDEAHRNV